MCNSIHTKENGIKMKKKTKKKLQIAKILKNARTCRCKTGFHIKLANSQTWVSLYSSHKEKQEMKQKTKKEHTS